MFENIRNDFQAHGCNWGAGILGHGCLSLRPMAYGVRRFLVRKLWPLIYRILFKFIQTITGIELPCETMVGRNFVIDHFGGIIVSGYAFGDNCRIRNSFVLDLRRVEQRFAAVIGNNVAIGTGPQRLGGITIDDNSIIGANAVVFDDVPENSMALGVRAIIKPRHRQHPALPAFDAES
jgi:serine O-acetyltransferase